MAKTVSTLSDDLASAIESAGPAVVRVEATRRLGACGLATGFVWSPDGVIATGWIATDTRWAASSVAAELVTGDLHP